MSRANSKLHNILRQLRIKWVGWETSLSSRKRNIMFESFSKRYFETPILIVSFNRLEYIEKLVASLEERGYNNIVIIDNYSTYEPLLQFYKTCNHKVVYLEKNYGHLAVWKSDKLKQYRKDFYVVTDPDVIPVSECPNDFIERFARILKMYPNARKVGFSLKIDDLPEDGLFTDTVLSWEKQFYDNRLKTGLGYVANIDTTFALYLPDQLSCGKGFFYGIRTEYPYQARHLPWYKTEQNITEEDLFYSKNKQNGWCDVSNREMLSDKERKKRSK